MTYEEFKEKVGNVILTDEGNCPVTPVVQMLQGKWKLQILYELCIKCPMRFGELKKMLKPITNTALTNALKELEADELVQRIQYNEMPLRVEYSLTEKGRDLLPVFYAISQWGMIYTLTLILFDRKPGSIGPEPNFPAFHSQTSLFAKVAQRHGIFLPALLSLFRFHEKNNGPDTIRTGKHPYRIPHAFRRAGSNSSKRPSRPKDFSLILSAM